MVVEALGYLGGVVVLVGVMLIVAQYWDDLSTTFRLILVGAAALVLLASGLAVPKRAGALGIRLQAVLFLLSTAATAAFIGLLARQVFEWNAVDVTLSIGVGTTIYAGAIWLYSKTLPQQLALFVASLVMAGAAAAELPDSRNLPGLAVWGGAAVWFLLGWGRIVPERRATIAAAAVGLLVGSTLTMDTDAGKVFALCTVALLVTIAIAFHDLLILAVGAWGALQVLPAIVTEWFPGKLAAPLALLLAGGAMVVVAIVLARSRKPAPEEAVPGRDLSHGEPSVAMGAALAVVVVVTAVILILGQ